MKNSYDIINKLKCNKERLKCFTIKSKLGGINQLENIKKLDEMGVYLIIPDLEPSRIYNIKNYKHLNKKYNYLIILPIIDYKSQRVYKMFYWIGDPNNIKNNFNLSYFTTILSYELNVLKMYREVCGAESEKFKRLFNHKSYY